MESRLRVQGHPIQPMLVTFPFGLFVCATVFDLTDVIGGPRFLGEVGYLTVVAALVATALTSIAGMVDLWDAPNDPIRRTAVAFNLVNAAMALLFVLVCLVRAHSAHRGASGGILAIELLALAVGAVGVRLGVILIRTFDRTTRGEAGGLDALRPSPAQRRPRPSPARPARTAPAPARSGRATPPPARQAAARPNRAAAAPRSERAAAAAAVPRQTRSTSTPRSGVV